MNRSFKLIAFSIIFLYLSGIIPIFSIYEIPLKLSENLVHAQEEQPEKTEEKEEKEEQPEQNKEKVPEKIKLPKQSKGISPETIRMIEIIEKKNTDLKNR